MLKFRSLLFLCTLYTASLPYSTVAKDIKLLVLIIASDQFPIYLELQKIWAQYMHYDPEHVEAYFIRGNPELESLYAIENDVIWSRTDEGWTPASAGILNKTIFSLEAMRSRFHEFDFVLRTNLSSFYVFPRLLEYLQHVPKHNCYLGSSLGDNSPIASGCGFIMSMDVAEMLIDNKALLLNNSESPDDVVIGFFMQRKGIRLIPHERLDVVEIGDWQRTRSKIPANIFQFRIKHPDEARMEADIQAHTELLHVFYNR